MKRPRFAALLPVKPPVRGKSRMRGVTEDQRVRLAAGFALDVVAACRATPVVGRVLAITDDAGFAAVLEQAGCDAVPDGVSDDLNETLRLAALEAARRWSGLVPFALCADLPALVPEDLQEALLAWGGPGGLPGFVPDADSLGTTLYVADAGRFAPAFGPGSRRAHLDAGATELPGELTTLRRDVDDLASLTDAHRLGLGPHTAAVVAEVAEVPAPRPG